MIGTYAPIGSGPSDGAQAADFNGAGRLRSGTRSTRWGLVAVTGVFLTLTAAPLLGLFAYAPCSMVFCPATVVILRKTLALTVSSSLIATLAAVVVGLPTALCLARLSFRGRTVANALVELPISLPPLVLGVALLLVWGRRGVIGSWLSSYGYHLSFTFTAVIIAQFVVAAPFFVRIAKAAIEQVPVSLEEASRTLGRGPVGTYLRVTLPLAQRGVLAGIITCWARAMSEFGATIMFAGNFPGRTQTVPLAIFSTMQYDTVTSVSLSIFMLAFSACTFVLAQMLLSRRVPG